MEFNLLLLEFNKLFIQQNERFLELGKENLHSLKANYSLISINKFTNNKPVSSKVFELLKNNEIVITIEKVSSALKEIESNRIIAHLGRENFRKISFPVFAQSQYLKTYLESSDHKFDLNSFIKNANFRVIELDL